MGPQAYKWWKKAKCQKDRRLAHMLESAQHFLIGSEVRDTVSSLIELENEKHENPDYFMTYFWDLPAELLVLEHDRYALLVRETENYVCFWIDGLPFTPEGHFAYDKNNETQPLCISTKLEGYTRESVGEKLSSILARAELTFSLIQQPRIVKRGRSEKDKKAMRSRGLNPRKFRWERISWWPEQEVQAKSSNGKGPEKPLHFARAYWSRAKEGEPKATDKRPLPDRSGYYPGWWRKVKHSWRGNPRVGIVLHHNTPRMTKEDRNVVERKTNDPELNRRMSERLEEQWSDAV